MSLSRRRRISVAVVDVTELADEATSALALRYHDLDFSAPRVSIAPCLRFVHALFRPDYNTPRLAASLSAQPCKYISLSPAFLSPSLQRTFGRARCPFVTRLPDRVTDSVTRQPPKLAIFPFS